MDIGILEKLNYDEQSIQILKTMCETTESYAKLTGNDFFVDVFFNEKEGVVISHGRPDYESLYSGCIEGAKVLAVNEPMVFYTMKTGIGMRDARATSQENTMVLQHTFPIKNGEKVIGVLIQEKNITEQVMIKNKMNHMERLSETLANTGMTIEEQKENVLNNENILLQETNHRIKNSLQLICSIMRMQKRRCKSAETQSVLTEDINRINGLASFYDLMTISKSQSMDLSVFLEQITKAIKSVNEQINPNVSIEVNSNKIIIDANKCQTIALITNEIIQNAYKHGFKNEEEGTIKVEAVKGNTYVTLNIFDNGIGFDERTVSKDCMGLQIAETLAKEKLKGCFDIKHLNPGTLVSVQFPL